ncbi:MAG: hypothetical protein ONB44_11285 [candidate division KSB1 bacterium]|nr:hypothetical protein [candidate division KSB1 bacterium]MDZ7302706.1 hypothetical protein [candidate division KSB1 bacterium]MDZ7311763.1 hypothetical protein [candidate division KSB1 bacterium]
MFIGHYAVALAAKKAAPKVSLGTLILSAQFIDLLWPIFLLLGLEHVRIDPGNTAFTPLDFYDYPISHSLLAVMGWSLGVGLIYFIARRYARGAWILGACVVSHWLLDAVTHRPDLPLFPGGNTHIGLGLWNSFAASALVELVMFVAGIIMYARTTTALDRTGRYAFWALVIFLGLIWVSNMLSPPPPNETTIAIASLSLWVIVPWAYWIDRHRQIAADQ